MEVFLNWGWNPLFRACSGNLDGTGVGIFLVSNNVLEGKSQKRPAGA